MGRNGLHRLNLYNKKIVGQDPNAPYWQCKLCRSWNSDLRLVCVFCDKGKKMRSCRRAVRPTAKE